MGRINVCVACDDNYSRYAAVVIASILANAKDDDDLYFYILDGGISEVSRTKMLKLTTIRDCNINFVNIDDRLFDDYKNVKTHSYLSLPAYYRLKAPSLLPEVGRIIYLDCDVVVNSSLDELFNMDLDGLAIGGVSDIKLSMRRRNPGYVNSGVLVMDLDNMRKNNIEQVFLDWTRENFEKIKTGDQEIINSALLGKIKLLSSKWNVQTSNFTNRSSYEKRPNVIHYVGGQKPWKPASWNYFKWFYRQYEDMTPWAEHRTAKEIKRDDIEGMKGYLKYRPLFFLRPRFYKAVYYTYIRPLK